MNLILAHKNHKLYFYSYYNIGLVTEMKEKKITIDCRSAYCIFMIFFLIKKIIFNLLLVIQMYLQQNAMSLYL